MIHPFTLWLLYTALWVSTYCALDGNGCIYGVVCAEPSLRLMYFVPLVKIAMCAVISFICWRNTASRWVTSPWVWTPSRPSVRSGKDLCWWTGMECPRSTVSAYRTSRTDLPYTITRWWARLDLQKRWVHKIFPHTQGAFWDYAQPMRGGVTL